MSLAEMRCSHRNPNWPLDHKSHGMLMGTGEACGEILHLGATRMHFGSIKNSTKFPHCFCVKLNEMLLIKHL